MQNATITLTYDCPECGGRGEIPEVVRAIANGRTIVPAHPCDACQTFDGKPGKLTKNLSLAQLKGLLDDVVAVRT